MTDSTKKTMYRVVLMAGTVPFTDLRPSEGGHGLYCRDGWPRPPAPEKDTPVTGTDYADLGEAEAYASQLSRDLLGLYHLAGGDGKRVDSETARLAADEGDRFRASRPAGKLGDAYQKEFAGGYRLLKAITREANTTYKRAAGGLRP